MIEDIDEVLLASKNEEDFREATVGSPREFQSLTKSIYVDPVSQFGEPVDGCHAGAGRHVHLFEHAGFGTPLEQVNVAIAGSTDVLEPVVRQLKFEVEGDRPVECLVEKQILKDITDIVVGTNEISENCKQGQSAKSFGLGKIVCDDVDTHIKSEISEICKQGKSTKSFGLGKIVCDDVDTRQLVEATATSVDSVHEMVIDKDDVEDSCVEILDTDPPKNFENPLIRTPMKAGGILCAGGTDKGTELFRYQQELRGISACEQELKISLPLDKANPESRKITMTLLELQIKLRENPNGSLLSTINSFPQDIKIMRKVHGQITKYRDMGGPLMSDSKKMMLDRRSQLKFISDEISSKRRANRRDNTPKLIELSEYCENEYDLNTSQKEPAGMYVSDGINPIAKIAKSIEMTTMKNSDLTAKTHEVDTPIASLQRWMETLAMCGGDTMLQKLHRDIDKCLSDPPELSADQIDAMDSQLEPLLDVAKLGKKIQDLLQRSQTELHCMQEKSGAKRLSCEHLLP